ncbi:hypothetical protein L484_025198 [Morus notabilis]|uniref:Uncharacterized protein n=1 Tax=Morus notabilis TaxID=981085 RepID=W9S248_9ROSA|nr:hypothetical protein L484_025198 [Morus notabilis]
MLSIYPEGLQEKSREGKCSSKDLPLQSLDALATKELKIFVHFFGCGEIVISWEGARKEPRSHPCHNLEFG